MQRAPAAGEKLRLKACVLHGADDVARTRDIRVVLHLCAPRQQVDRRALRMPRRYSTFLALA